MSDQIPSLPAIADAGSAPALKNALHRWRRLSGDSRSVIVVALLAALVAAAIVIILWTSTGQYAPLYGQQERYSTAAVLEVLDTEGISYRLDGRDGYVMVPKNQVANARMKLAARGVTAQLPAGLDGLTDLSSISTSQFMESNRYTHAVEGELARTIMTLNPVRHARVHLALPERTLFVGRDEQKPKASVTLDLSGTLQESQVEAIVNLVAASVPGLEPGGVSVVDQDGTLLSAGIGADNGSRVSARQMDYATRLEQRIASRAEDMLSPLLGQNNFRVRVAADVDFSQVEETREVLDAQPILLNETSLIDNSVGQLALGVPGALANQPPGGGAENEENNGQGNRREEVSRRFDTGRAVTHTRLQDARIQQLQVSVLVNDAVAPEGGWSEQQLANMTNIVQTATGIRPDRGDVLTLHAAPFAQPVRQAPEPVAVPWWEQLHAWENYIRYALGTLMLMLLILFGIRPLVRHLTQSASRKDEQQRMPAVTDADDDSTTHTPRAAATEGSQHDDAAEQARQSPEQGPSQATLSLPPPGSELEVQLEHLRLLADQETNRVAEVIKSWVQEQNHGRNA